MGCKRTAIRVGKRVGRAVGPVLLRRIGRVILLLADTGHTGRVLDNETKRLVAFWTARVLVDEAGLAVSDSQLNLVVEYLVQTLLKQGEALEDVGEEDSDEGAAEELQA